MIKLVRIPNPSALRLGLFRLGAVVAGLVIAGSLLAAMGGAPLQSVTQALAFTLGTSFGVQDLGTLLTPLILTGLAVGIAMRMQLWNIGAEGQFYLGAWAAAGIGIHVGGSPWVVLPLMIVAGAVAGALWVALPAIARAKGNVNEIISTLLLNFVAVLWVSYFATGPWKDTTQATNAASLRVPYALPEWFGIWNIGIFVALALVGLVWFAMNRTLWGYELLVNGANREAARYAGIRVDRQLVTTLLISGAVAGIAGAIEMSGTVSRLQVGISNQYGYFGIIVAVLAAGRPWGIVLSAVLFGTLLNCGIALQAQGLSLNVVVALTGLLLLLLAVAEIFATWRIVLLPAKEV